MLLECIRQTSICQSFLEPLIFWYEFYHFKLCNFISVLQTQIGENPDNVNNAESYSLGSNYRQLTKLVRIDASQKIVTEKVQHNLL